MNNVIFGRVVSLRLIPFHSLFIEVTKVKDTYPLNWPDKIIQHYAGTANQDILERKPALKGVWLKAERVRVIQGLIARLGWTYERGFGWRQAERLVELAFENRGLGQPSKIIRRNQRETMEAQVILSQLSDNQLQETWNALCKMTPVRLALEEGPYDDTLSMADFMKACFWEMTFRKADGALLQI